MIKNHYNTLGIQRTASRAEIQKAFRRLAFECHPDRNPNNPKAKERFQKINEAYMVLMDDGQRRAHDAQFVNGYSYDRVMREMRWSDEAFSGWMEDILADLFDHGGRL